MIRISFLPHLLPHPVHEGNDVLFAVLPKPFCLSGKRLTYIGERNLRCIGNNNSALILKEDKKIILYRKTNAKDSAGFTTAKYTPIHPGRSWAYVRQLSASEFYAARAVQQTEEMLFTRESAR